MRQLALILISITITTLFPASFSYTLDGQWVLLSPDASSVSANSNVVFHFNHKKDAQKEVQQLFVGACKNLTYKYCVSQNKVFFQQINSSAVVYPCVANFLDQLQQKLNSTFTFSIRGNLLVLNNPQSQGHLLLKRKASNAAADPSLVGYRVWIIETIYGSVFNDLQNLYVYNNNSYGYYCNFHGQFRLISNSTGAKVEKDQCSNQELTRMFSQFVFSINVGNKRILFNQSLDQIAILVLNKNIDNQTFNSLKSKALSYQKQNASSSSTKSQSGSNNNGQAGSNVKAVPPQGQTQSTPNKGFSFFLQYQPTEEPQKNNIVIGKKVLEPFNKRLLFRKWYLYAQNGEDKNIEQYFYYFLIFSPKKIIFYGGCEVRWSNYTLTQNTLSGINTQIINKSTTAQCINNNHDQKVLKPFFQQVKYVDYAHTQKVPYVMFYDNNMKHLAIFHAKPPTFPPVKQ